MRGRKVRIAIKDIQDFRNYKVSCERAKTYLGFQPKYAIPDITRDLYRHLAEYGDMGQSRYYSVGVFRGLPRG